MKRLSPTGEALIKSFETLRLEAYQDGGGVWTIGWGHTGPEVRGGLTCTPEAAEAWFLSDTQTAVDAVNRTVTVDLNQNQFDALVSFTYNVGRGAFSRSTLLKLLNSNGDAADQFLLWDHVNGVRSDGLHRRRVAERSLFLS